MPSVTGMVKQLVRDVLPEGQGQALLRLKMRWDFCRRHGSRYRRMSLFKLIEGFLLDEEAIALYDLAAALPDAAVVVEIGSWVGKSSVVLGSALVRKNGARLYCVDPFDASGDPRSEARYHIEAERLGKSLREAFEDSIRRAGVARVVEVMAAYSHEVVADWRRPIDMLFIDGNHAFEAVRRDFTDWSPFVRPGGLLAFHDTYLSPPAGPGEYHAGPGEVVKQFMLLDPVWIHVCHVHSLFVARKLDRRAPTGRQRA